MTNSELIGSIPVMLINQSNLVSSRGALQIAGTRVPNHGGSMYTFLLNSIARAESFLAAGGFGITNEDFAVVLQILNDAHDLLPTCDEYWSDND